MTSWSKITSLAAVLILVADPALAQVSQAERQQAAREHPQVLAQFGGAYEGPQQAYLNQVGQRVAQAAGVPGGCTFTLVNTDIVNAFAVPGCYVYVTRGLMGLANSEDELAFVMGHEIGHIMGKHAQKRQNTSALTGLAAILLGAVTKSDAVAGLLGQGAQLYTLSYSRTQEYEADDLGSRYLLRAGYSPQGAPAMLDVLQRHDALMARTQGRDAKSTPEWASTHPLAAERVRRASIPVQAPGAPRADLQRDRYLDAINGMTFGDDPAQGFVRGRSFVHPELRIAFDAPQGFSLTNGAQAVSIEGPGGQKALFGGGRLGSNSLEGYAAGVMRQIVGEAQARVGNPQRTTINGLEAVILPARVQTNGGVAELTVAAYRMGGDTAYQFVTLAPAGGGGTFEPMYRSMRRISDQEASGWRARDIEVVPVRPGETVAELASRMVVDEQPRVWFETLNNVDDRTDLRTLQRVKIISYGR